MTHPLTHGGTDEGTELVHCALVGVSDLLAMLSGVHEVQPERPWKRVTGEMLAVADCLRQLAAFGRRQNRDEQLIARLRRAIADGLDAVWLTTKAHALAGLSADGTVLVLCFADCAESRELPLPR